MKNAVKSLEKGQLRNLNVTLRNDPIKIYIDEKYNLMFKNAYLKESEILVKGSQSVPGDAFPDLLKLIIALKDEEMPSAFKLIAVDFFVFLENFKGSVD